MQKKITCSKFIDILLILGSIICILIIIYTGITFCSKQISFSKEYINVCETVKSLETAENTIVIEKQIDYLSKLQELQENTMTTDLIVFLYSFLSTIFVGVGAYYLKNVKSNAEKAQNSFTESEKLSKKTEENCRSIKKQMKKSQKNISKIAKNCTDSEKQITNICDDLNSRSRTLMCIQNAHQAANLVLTITFACERLDTSNVNEKNNLAMLMPRLNESLKFLVESIKYIDIEKVNKKDVEMLRFTLHEITKSFSRCKSCNDIFFSDKIVKKVSDEINDCLKRIRIN